MGWLWSSSTTKPPTDPPSHDTETSQTSTFIAEFKDQQNTAASSSPFTPDTPESSSSASDPSSSSPSSNNPNPRTRDQIANDEILSFFRHLEAERKRAAEPPPDDNAAADDDDDDDDDEDPPELLTPARLYDTRAKCGALFDEAFFCSSPGGHFYNVYRHGTFAQCESVWKDYMWCLRTNRRWMNERAREERTVRHAWERERDRLRERGGCSEEVWGPQRRWAVKGAFQADWEGEDSPFSRKEGGGI